MIVYGYVVFSRCCWCKIFALSNSRRANGCKLYRTTATSHAGRLARAMRDVQYVQYAHRYVMVRWLWGNVCADGVGRNGLLHYKYIHGIDVFPFFRCSASNAQFAITYQLCRMSRIKSVNLMTQT